MLDGSHLLVGCRKVEPADAREGNGRRAHGAGLQRDIEIATGEPFGAHSLRRRTNRQQFGMSRRIPQLEGAVARRGHNSPGRIRDGRAHRHLAAGRSRFGFGKGLLHGLWKIEAHRANWNRGAKSVKGREREDMRIVGGRFKGHGLAAPPGLATRPTTDRVRESIFNILAHGIAGFAIEGARVLDLFAGTGALGLEAISRGARFCQFVDESAQARGIIRRNADALGVIGLVKIWRRDAARLGACAPQPGFDLVFADPPYGRGLGEAALHALAEGGWLNAGAVVVLEETIKAAVAEVPGLTLIDRRDYGDTQIRFYRLPHGNSGRTS